jgi:hypothetical protein
VAYKTDAVREGDIAKVSFEGRVVVAFSGGMTIAITGGDGVAIGFSNIDVAAESFKVEKIVPPIAVGDMVEWEVHATDSTSGLVAGHVLALANGYAMIESPFQVVPHVVDVRLLRHG